MHSRQHLKVDKSCFMNRIKITRQPPCKSKRIFRVEQTMLSAHMCVCVLVCECSLLSPLCFGVHGYSVLLSVIILHRKHSPFVCQHISSCASLAVDTPGERRPTEVFIYLHNIHCLCVCHSLSSTHTSIHTHFTVQICYDLPRSQKSRLDIGFGVVHTTVW